MSLNPVQINELAQHIYKQNVARGWWDDPNRDPIQTLQLVVTEVAEATEGDRKDLMDDHLPERKMVEVELADTLIRLLDLAGRYNWRYEYRGAHSCLARARNLAAKHFWLVRSITDLGEVVLLEGAGRYTAAISYSVAVGTVLAIAEQEGYDLEAAIAEKMAYNATRADHQREARRQDGGKRY